MCWWQTNKRRTFLRVGVTNVSVCCFCCFLGIVVFTTGKVLLLTFCFCLFFFLILFFSCFSPYTYLLLSPHFVFFAAATITSCGRHHSRAKIIIRSVSLLFWRTGSCLLFLLQWLSRWRTRCSVKDQREYLSKKQWENSLPKRWKKV